MDGDFTWIPKCFTVTDSSSDYVSGWVVNESELSSLLEAHQRAFLCSFVSWSDDVKKKEKSERRLLWMHDGLSSSDYPYIVDRSVVYNCQYGKSRKPSKRESKVEKNETDHEYIRKKRFLIQNTKKVECDAKIYVRHINRYIDYAVPENANRRVRQLQLDDLTVKLRIGNIQAETVITVKLPLKGAHKNHLLTIESGFSKSMNSKLREYISNHVQMGVTSVPYIRKLLKFYVEHELTQTEIVQPSPNDRSYFPTNRDIYNCVHAALVAGRYSNFDQENVSLKIENWQKEKNDEFFLRPTSEEKATSKQIKKLPILFKNSEIDEENEDIEDIEVQAENSSNTFLFIHQSERQKKLLEKYGEMVLIDATYKTTKYALPLFLVVVRTNVGYVPVAEFVTENERAESIKEALIIIKDWNPNWSPKYFMMDYSDAEYQAIHHTFPDSEKYLCYFHVEQAWTRWTRQKKNGLSDSEREQLMTMLRKIANAPTRLIYDRAIEELKSSIIYKNNNRVKSYIDNFWLNIVERWCRIFFKNGFHLNVTTNNGVEALNNSLKKFYLKLTSNGTLSSLIDIIVNDFIPDQLRTYTQMNYQYCSHYKKYNQYVPMFLRNKPRNVVKHCLPRYASAEMYTPEDVDAISNEVFLVKSESRSNEFYNVDLGSLSRLPSCSCADFVKSYLPCKHMFAVFRNTRFTWDDLSSIYTSSPYLNLDYNFLSANTSFDISATTDKSDDLHVTLQPFNTQEHQNQEHQNQEHNLSKQRKNLQGNIKTLESISYLSTCSDTLDEVNRQVCKLINMLKSTVDKENNLPLHQDATVKQKQETPKIFRKPLPLRKRKRKLSDVKTTTCQWKLTVPEPSFDGIIEDSSNIKEPNSYSEATSIYPKKAYERGGLLNPFGKNLCFANSVLQLLRQTDIHRLLLIHKECVANSNNHCFVCQFKIFIERSSDSAESLCRILMERWTDFTIGIQQDSHEFLKKIMDEIQEKCYSAVNHSSNLFYGQQTSTITCNNCGNMTSRTEIFSDISISIDKAQNILEAMKEHFAAEKVDYYCSHCKSNTSAVKDTKLDYIPKNLILHLKRFDNSGKKICKMVDIHSNLQLGDFVSKDKAIVDQAKLVGMVVHCGKSLQTGHYYALIEFGDQWYIFDDMKIQKLAGPIQLKLDSTNNPYLLLYKMLQ